MLRAVLLRHLLIHFAPFSTQRNGAVTEVSLLSINHSYGNFR